MRVAFVTTQDDPAAGGLYYFEQAVLEALATFPVGFDVVRVHRSTTPVASTGFPSFVVPASPGSKAARLSLNGVLERERIDLVWFLGGYEPCDWPYVFTTLDLAHRRYPEFPETSVFGWTYEAREQYYNAAIGRAVVVISGTEFGRAEIHDYYRKPLEKIAVLPFFSPKFPEAAQAVEVGPAPFFHYPARFWPHKNHRVLIDAMAITREKGENFSLVLVGSERDNRDFLEEKIREAALTEWVKLLGFVTRSELKWLYSNSLGLVFPTYFGPDNLPPLEALTFGCPAIVSAIPGSREQLGDAVLYCDPGDPHAWADSMQALSRQSIEVKGAAARGSGQLAQRSAKRYVDGITEVVAQVASTRRCWGDQAAFIAAPALRPGERIVQGLRARWPGRVTR